MSEIVWLASDLVQAIHAQQLKLFGGPPGLRDEGTLESDLGRPNKRAGYGEPDLAVLTAAYAFGIARNHPFVDGNKRSAWVAARLFLRLNEVSIVFDKAEATILMQRLAAGELAEDQVAAWLRERLA